MRALVLGATLLTVAAAAPAARAQTAPVKAGSAKAGSARIGVATLGPAGLPTDLRIRLEDAAAAGLRASGAEVVSATELSRARAAAALGACTDAVCEQRLAQITDTRYWLRGTCTLDTSTYRTHLELTDARTGAVLGARDDTCDICTEAEAAESVNIAASALKAKVARSQMTAANVVSPARSPSPTAAATVTTPPAPAAQPSTSGPADSTNGSGGPESAPGDSGTPAADTADAGGGDRPMWRRVLPWVAFAGAAGAIAGGAYYLSVDGDPTCTIMVANQACKDSRDTGVQYFPLFGVGAALVATGIVLLVLPGPAAAGATSPSVAAPPSTVSSLGLGISTRGFSLSGRF